MSGNERETGAEIAALPEETRGVRLRRLVALEWVQTALGVGLLVAIAVRAFVTAKDDTVGSVLVIAGMGAMLVFTFRLRMRLGCDSLRRDVQALELRRDLELPQEPRSTFGVGIGAYRGRLLRPVRAAVTRLRRGWPLRRLRPTRPDRLRARARHAHAREHGLRRR